MQQSARLKSLHAGTDLHVAARAITLNITDHSSYSNDGRLVNTTERTLQQARATFTRNPKEKQDIGRATVDERALIVIPAELSATESQRNDIRRISDQVSKKHLSRHRFGVCRVDHR